MTEDEKRKLLSEAVPPLLAWFEAEKRPLPWRESRDPYRIWISEIMLQQTRIEAVIPHYVHFLADYPGIPELAAAPEEEVLKHWEGLGYYSRCRNLHRAAKLCMAEYGGRLPSTYAMLRRLPGLGEYTAGAIASMGFGEAVSAVDGNVLRILSRLLAEETDVMKPAVRTLARERIEDIMPEQSPGAFNEALMELGERVCLPGGEPRCGVCPWEGLCLAHERGLEEQLPVRSKGMPRRIENRTVFLFISGKTVAIRKRPPRGLLADLYEFPSREGRLTEEEAARFVLEQYGIRTEVRSLGTAVHVFSHVEWHMIGYVLQTEQPLPGLLYGSRSDLEDRYALPTAFRYYREKTMKLLQQEAP